MSSIFYGRPLAVAFLDMDGVMSDRLYNEKTQEKVAGKYLQLLKQPRYLDRSIFSESKAEYVALKRSEAACISESALKRLQSLAGRVEGLGLRLVFVISSAWREFLTNMSSSMISALMQQSFIDTPAASCP